MVDEHQPLHPQHVVCYVVYRRHQPLQGLLLVALCDGIHYTYMQKEWPAVHYQPQHTITTACSRE
jgi:frataxin-like iron-binding protein CyaY